MCMDRKEAVNDITLFDAFLFCLCLYQTKTVYLYLSAFFTCRICMRSKQVPDHNGCWD